MHATPPKRRQNKKTFAIFAGKSETNRYEELWSTISRRSSPSGSAAGRTDKTYKVETDPSRPKFYVLDMFPYPSGAGLHVGHPLGYIASDIYSRYKRLRRASTSCTRWVTTPSACPPSSTPSRRASIPPSRPSRTSPATASSWTRSDSRSTGTARCALATPAITNGRSGRSSRCSAPITATTSSRRARSKS